MPSNERSAEFCRGAVAVLCRMVDECSTVFDSDLPHITQGNLEDYLAEYADLLAAAEVREAIPGDILSTTVEKLREACRGVRVEPKPDAPTAAEVIEAAERERDELLAESAYIKQQLEWVKENGDTYQKSALMDFIRRTIHGISHTAAMKEALAAHDAQQRREGAIEALEDIAKDSGIDGGKAYIAKVVYREFPDLLHMSVGVVDAADLMQAAKRLRERGE